MSLADLAGHQPVVERLQRSLAHGRLAHAYLFIGPRGSRRLDTARTLAQALNCERGEPEACGACDSCQRIARDKHPDIYYLRPESKTRRIQVRQIREFEQAIMLKPSMARLKVGIIVDAECMMPAASNAFLKTLEEPPAQTIIILLTAEPQRLLPTILSRCLRVSFGAVEIESPWRDKVIPLLCDLGQTGHAVAAVYRLHAALTGLLQQTRDEISQRFADEESVQHRGDLEASARDRLEKQRDAQVEGEYRLQREQLIEVIYTWFGDILLCAAGADRSLLAHPEQETHLRQVADDLGYHQAAARLEAVDQLRDALDRNVSEAFVFEVGLLKLAGLAPAGPVSTL